MQAKKKVPRMATPPRKTPKPKAKVPKRQPVKITPVDLDSQAWRDDCAANAWLDSL